VINHFKKKIALTVWNEYNFSKANEEAAHADQTSEFFKSIDAHLYPAQFLNNDNETETNIKSNSYKKIIQLGISNAYFMRKFFPNISPIIIGYDFSNIAVELNGSKGILTRNVDLNDIEISDNTLGYADLLKSDLDSSNVVLMLRILEYLEAEALQLLIFFLINYSKSGTSFFIEIFSKDEEEKSQNLIHNNLKFGYVASFFAPRTDMEFNYHKKIFDSCDKGNIERLIINKTQPG
jgi:hypothetical protein